MTKIEGAAHDFGDLMLEAAHHGFEKDGLERNPTSVLAKVMSHIYRSKELPSYTNAALRLFFNEAAFFSISWIKRLIQDAPFHIIFDYYLSFHKADCADALRDRCISVAATVTQSSGSQETYLTLYENSNETQYETSSEEVQDLILLMKNAIQNYKLFGNE